MVKATALSEQTVGFYFSCYLTPNQCTTDYHWMSNFLEAKIGNTTGGVIFNGDINARMVNGSLPFIKHKMAVYQEKATRLSLHILHM